MQDPDAARVIFDSGVPFVQIPCLGVASHLLTTRSELDETIKGRNAISDFLYERFLSPTAAITLPGPKRSGTSPRSPTCWMSYMLTEIPRTQQ